MRSVGNTPGPEEPHHAGFDANDLAEPTRPHASPPPSLPRPVHGAEPPDGAASDVISALGGDALGATSVQATSNRDKPARVPRTISDTVIPQNVRPGTIEEVDNPNEKFSPEERRIAEKLAGEGYNVKQVPRSDSRTADAVVSGNQVDGFQPIEFKSMNPPPGTVSDSATVRNEVHKSIRRGGQARDMILDGRGTGLTKDEAHRGLNRIVIRNNNLDSVRVLGDGFDLTAKFHFDKK